MGGATYVSDARGNLTSDAARTYSYDLDNHLTGVSGAQALTLAYDPLGRLRTVTTGGTTTTWLWDGDRLVAEYDNAGALSARYAHGPGPDEPLVDWFKTTSAGRLWFHTDHQNTVVALTDGTGAISGSPLTYDAYGQPAGGTYTGPRFRFTGQTSLPGAPPLWHYKARVYAPGIGRFLQTDPIGYEDSLNLYQYVGNDPFNGTDPTGKESFLICRSVAVIGQHCFVVVTNSDGSQRAQFSYGPQSDDPARPGQLVQTAGNPGSSTNIDDDKTVRGDIEETHRVNLNDFGFEDDDVVAAGQRVDALVGTPSAPGPTRYNALVSGRGQANSNAGAARVLEEAKPGSSDDRRIRPDGYAPGWSRPDAVGTAPPPPSTYDACAAHPAAC